MIEYYRHHNNGNESFQLTTLNQPQTNTALANEKYYMGAQHTFSIQTYAYDKWLMDMIP